MRKLTRLSVALALVWNIIVMILTPVLLPLYDLGTDTKQLILIIVAIHNLFSATMQPFSGPLSSGLRAAGDVKFTMWASIFATVICRTHVQMKVLLINGSPDGKGCIHTALTLAAEVLNREGRASV